MAAVDPYAPCPCGSGEKYKWCCQKIEQYTERSQRLYENGQHEAALEALAEGLRKEPNNAWLLTRQALILLSEHKLEQAKTILERVVARQPEHFNAHAMLIQTLMAMNKPEAAAKQLQAALAACPAEKTAVLFPLIRLVGLMFADSGDLVPALAHVRLAFRYADDDEDARLLSMMIRNMSRTAERPPWIRNEYLLESPQPEALSRELREPWANAITQAEQGRWERAAESFDKLAKAGAGPLADRNAGLCRLWIADHEAGVQALRRYIAKAGETVEAVDLEALCQTMSASSKDGHVESVRLIWPLRDREGLLAALRAAADVRGVGEAPLDPSDENSPKMDEFELFDRPAPAPGTKPEPGKLPAVVAYAYVGKEIAALEAYDDETLGPLSDRFTSLAGASIAPAQPRTKVMGSSPKSHLPFLTEYWMPEDIGPEEEQNLRRAELARVTREVWPNTPQDYLGGRTPVQAAKAGNARVPLRAALLTLEVTAGTPIQQDAVAAARQLLGVSPEPEIEPEGLAIDSVNLARLHLVHAEKLDDDALLELFERATVSLVRAALERAARAIIDRPALFADPRRVDVVQVYGVLSSLAAHESRAAAFEWIKKGREADPPSQRAEHAPAWDMMEIQTRARFETPEAWVPELALVLDRYEGNNDAKLVLLNALIEMGLVRLSPHPQDNGTMIADARLLEAILAQYGPKIATASGRLGVSASKGGIWTPGSDTPSASPSGIWTPGAGAAPGGTAEKSKLIVPGR